MFFLILLAIFLATFFMVITIIIISSSNTSENHRIYKLLDNVKISKDTNEALSVFQNQKKYKQKVRQNNDNIIYLFSSPLAALTYFILKNNESYLPDGMTSLVFVLPMVIFVLIPFFYKKILNKSRHFEILNLLPLLIDLLTICIESGLSFTMSLEKIIQETPIKSKFFFQNLHLAVLEMNAGVERGEALHSLVKRCYNNSELKSFVSAIIQSETFGFSIAKTLQTQAQELRNKKRQIIRTRISKMPIELLFPLIFCIAPITCILLAGPGLIDILTAL